MKNFVENLTPDQATFLEWCALPKKLRKPRTQRLLAEQIGVDENTLTRWKKLDGWLLAVAEIAREYMGDDLPDIFAALAREAKKGSAPHIKMALEVTGVYVQRTDITSGGRPFSAPTVYLPAIATKLDPLAPMIE